MATLTLKEHITEELAVVSLISFAFKPKMYLD